jgi:transcriptional regulator with XRE-family HTH domain
MIQLSEVLFLNNCTTVIILPNQLKMEVSLYNYFEVVQMTFAERLKMLRQEKEVTQLKIGELLGVSARMISFYEIGKHIPREAESLIILAKYFDVSLDYLLGMSNVRNYNQLVKSFKAYSLLSDKGKEEADEYMLFLNQKYK